MNKATQPYSMHPHGVAYERNSEGSTPYPDTSMDGAGLVPPGQMHTFVWNVPERAGPGDDDGSSVIWLYHSHNWEPRDVNAGLIGPMVITRRGNGYMFGNLPMPVMKLGEHVRWYVMTMGGQVNLHTPHWHGNVLTIDKHHTDIFSILPAQFVTADMVPDKVGIWMFHCHIDEHMEGGMTAMYQVQP